MKARKKVQEFWMTESVTIICSHVDDIFRARVITTLFDGDVAVDTLIIYLN